MRRVYLLCCCLLLALACAGGVAPLLAADPAWKPSVRADDRGKAPSQKDVAEFCRGQRQLCRRLCDLRTRFDDRFDGCAHSCDSRGFRCGTTACYGWTAPELELAQKYGAHKCVL